MNRSPILALLAGAALAAFAPEIIGATTTGRMPTRDPLPSNRPKAMRDPDGLYPHQRDMLAAVERGELGMHLFDSEIERRALASGIYNLDIPPELRQRYLYGDWDAPTPKGKVHTYVPTRGGLKKFKHNRRG